MKPHISIIGQILTINQLQENLALFRIIYIKVYLESIYKAINTCKSISIYASDKLIPMIILSTFKKLYKIEHILSTILNNIYMLYLEEVYINR